MVLECVFCRKEDMTPRLSMGLYMGLYMGTLDVNNYCKMAGRKMEQHFGNEGLMGAIEHTVKGP